jgi:predicted pyridoxine 5'-phosphate oxidase superfamily flavin-nucleotide-binding protein
VIHVESAYFQCSRAVVRSDIWNPDKHVDLGSLPTPGAILAGLTDERMGGPEYDRAWPARARATLW